MGKSVNSIDTIKNKIIAEAREYENSVLASAQKEAAETAALYEKKAQEAKERILCAAKQNADGIISSAESSQNMRARNSLLAGKGALIDGAYEKAVDTIAKLPRDEYLSLFAAYLEKAAQSAALCEGKATLFVGKAAPVSCAELMAAAEQTEAVKAVAQGGQSDRDDAGFCLVVGDITLDCFAKTIVSAIKNDTQTGVAKLLFAQD